LSSRTWSAAAWSVMVRRYNRWHYN